MKVCIFAFEDGLYHGQQGVYATQVVEVSDLASAHNYGAYMSDSLVSNYLREAYAKNGFEDLREYLTWHVYPIKDSVTASAVSLNKELVEIGFSDFIKEYCESED